MAIIYDSDGLYNTIQPAYNPIPYIVEDDGLSGLGGVPPVIYCDIYFNFIYYKTIVATSPTTIAGITSFWYFDISGICQEFLTTKVPDITENDFQQTFGSGYIYGAARCFVKFRNSTQDIYGVITPGGTPPVQATYDTPAISGDGWQSDTFMIVNAALQITDSQGSVSSFEDMLKQFRISGTFIGGFYPQNVDPAYRVYPLTYLKQGKVYTNDWGLLPFICCRNGFLGSSTVIANITLMVFSPSGALTYMNNISGLYLNDYSIYYLPTGVNNMLALFPGAAGSLVAGNSYRIGFFDPAYSYLNKFIFVTPLYFIQTGDALTAGTYPLLQPYNVPKHTRIWFQNYLGHFDQLNFIEREEHLKVTSAPTETPLKALSDGFGRSNTSMSRNNVRSNENNVVTSQFNEGDMPFIKQLLATGKGYIEFVSPEGGEDPPVALMLPIVITDSDFVTLTWEDRYEYRLSVKYIMSNENKIVRN